MSDGVIYKLAMYTSEIDKWVFINKPFMIENENLLSGVFLRDIWFCYKINKNYNDIHFMILKIKNNPNEWKQALKIINKNHVEGNIKPSINDKPGDVYSDFSKYFHLDNKTIKNIKTQIKNENKESHIIKLYDDNCEFNIELIKFEDIFMITLPRFNIY